MRVDPGSKKKVERRAAPAAVAVLLEVAGGQGDVSRWMGFEERGFGAGRQVGANQPRGLGFLLQRRVQFVEGVTPGPSRSRA
jgi:hypothetical protein